MKGGPNMEQKLLEELYQMHYREALLYALALCGDEILAEDLVSDAFVKALVSLDNSHPAFQYWLFRVLKNQWLDHLRREKRQPNFSPAILPTPEQIILQDERNQVLWQALNRLSSTDREVITLHYFSGLTIRQIAQMLGQTSGAVKTRLSRLRQRIKQEMEEQGYEI